MRVQAFGDFEIADRLLGSGLHCRSRTCRCRFLENKRSVLIESGLGPPLDGLR